MKVKYKKVTIKVVKEFCPICEEELQGNNSILFPYKCSCGTWQYSGKEFDFIIKK